MKEFKDKEISLLLAQNEALKEQIQQLQKQINSVMPETLQAMIKEENEQLQVVNNAINHYGIFLQKLVAIEEMAELIKEIIKSFRGEKNRENIVEEIADVEIMMQQLSLIHDCTFEVVEMRRKKIERLKKRLENDNTTTEK
jgi:uncharacterized membrane protein